MTSGPASPPVRVMRSGIWRYAPLTREQVRQACLYAEAWVRQTTWQDCPALMRGLGWMIGEQLGRPIRAVLEGVHDIDDMPVVRIVIGEFEHFVVFRDTRIVENDAAALLLGEEKIEQIVEQKMAAARERQAQYRPKGKVLEKGKIR